MPSSLTAAVFSVSVAFQIKLIYGTFDTQRRKTGKIPQEKSSPWADMDCFLESIAGMWIRMLRNFGVRTTSSDVIAEAKEQLRETIGVVNKQIQDMNSEISTITCSLRHRRSAMPKTELRKQVLQARKRRCEVDALQNKVMLMESQLDALENNEVNKTVLRTLQSSALALKDMGLQNDLLKADSVISELEEGMNQVHDINSTVSTGVVQLDLALTDDDLEAELDLLFDREVTVVKHSEQVVPSANSMLPHSDIPKAVAAPATISMEQHDTASMQVAAT